MADSFTPNLNMTKPEIDASAETWGQKLNADLDLLDQHAGSMVAFANAQPTNINNAVWGALAYVFPRGVIMAWWGQPNTVPPGWLLCNGLNGTPNLQDRFIMGTAGSRAVGEAGGGFSTSPWTDERGWHSHGGATGVHALTPEEGPSHQHGGSTAGAGGHVHNVPTQGDLGAGAGPYPVPVDKNYGMRGITTDNQGFHGHDFATDWRGASWGHNHGMNGDGNHSHNVTVSIVPPYMALCYIMRA